MFTKKKSITENVWSPDGKDVLLVVLHDISDPGNVGTMLRSCDWFGATAVFLCGTTVELYNPKVLRSTMGAVFHLPIFSGMTLDEIIAETKAHGCTVYATSLEGGKEVGKVPLDRKSVLILGSEAHGLDPSILKKTNQTLTIPKFGKSESLNVSIACGILLAAYRGVV